VRDVQVMAQSMEQQQKLQAAEDKALEMQQEADMRVRRLEIALRGKEAELDKVAIVDIGLDVLMSVGFVGVGHTRERRYDSVVCGATCRVARW